jgi:hypothetical protein
MKDDKHPGVTRDDLIVQIWEQLACESVGAKELKQIQQAVADRLGTAAVDSPASMARILADHGAELRHPEILDLDSEWRESRLSTFSAIDLSSLSGAVTSLHHLDSLRRQLEDSNSKSELSRLYESVNQMRDELALVAFNNKTNPAAQAQAKEISEWLSLWRNSPDLFADWLELRIGSPGFRSLFPDFHSPDGR